MRRNHRFVIALSVLSSLFSFSVFGQEASVAAAAAVPNPQMARVLEEHRRHAQSSSGRQQFSAQGAAKILARSGGKQLAPMPVGSTLDQRMIPGEDGNEIPIRIYRPVGNGPFAVLVYFHGGGFVIARVDKYDASARALTDYANAIVISVEYRKAPEHPYPAATRDASAAYRWALTNAGSVGGDTKRIAVGKDSAGGNLAP